MLGFPIRKSSDRRLLGTYPKRIAAESRPSSLHRVEASTIRPYNVPAGIVCTTIHYCLNKSDDVACGNTICFAKQIALTTTSYIHFKILLLARKMITHKQNIGINVGLATSYVIFKEQYWHEKSRITAAGKTLAVARAYLRCRNLAFIFQFTSMIIREKKLASRK